MFVLSPFEVSIKYDMVNVKIFSDYNFLVCGKNFEDEVCSFCFVDIFLQDNEKCYLRFFPLNQPHASIPFCVYICANGNQIQCNCPNIKIYQVLSHYEIFVEPFTLNTNNNCLTHNLQLAKSTCKICVWDDKVEFITKQYCHTEHAYITNPSFENINSNIIVYGADNNNNTCLLYCPKTNKCEKILYSQLELSDKKLKVLCDISTFLGHKTLQTYCFSENGPMLEKSELYQSPNQTKTIYPPEVIPYLFLECIKAKDFAGAKKFVDENLTTFSKQAFEDYFGSFKKIHLHSTKPLLYVIYNQQNASVFEFCLQNNKICDINKI